MKKILMLMLCMILLVGTVSAFEFDNVKSSLTPEQEITITNSFGLGEDLAKIKWNTPIENYKVGVGKDTMLAEFTIDQYYEGTYQDALANVDFYYKSNMKPKEKEFVYKRKVVTPRSKEECIIDNQTLKETCKTIEWEDIDYINYNGKDIIKGEVTIGIFAETYEGEYGELIPTFYGVRLPEFSSWNASLDNGNTAYFKFDEGTGDAVEEVYSMDLVESGTISNQSGLIESSRGAFGAGNDFNGNINHTLYEDQDYTINTWWYPTGTPGSGGRCIVWGDIVSGGYMLTLRHETDDKAYLVIFKNGVSAHINFGSSIPLKQNDWTMITVTFDGDNGNATLHFNGTSVGAGTETGYTGETNDNELDVGNQAGGSDCPNIYMDETGFWNRTLSQSEIEQLYNGGAGIAYGVTPPTGINITLNSPIDVYNSTSAIIIFNSTVFDNGGVNNVSIYIDNVLNETNSSGINNTNYIFTKTFIDGSYNWLIEACDNEDNCENSSSRSFTVDTIDPIINTAINLTNITTFTLPVYSLWNYTVNEVNLDKCYYNTSDNSTYTFVTCNVSQINTTWTTSGSKTIQYCANDTVSHEACSTSSIYINQIQTNTTYTTPVIETDNTTFTFNVTADLITSFSANLTYNGTVYTMVGSSSSTYAEYSYNLTVPEVSSNTDVNFSISYNINGDDFTTTNYTQTIYNIPDLVVSTSCDDKAIKFDLKDEGNLSALNGTFEYNFAYGIASNSSFIKKYGSITNENTFYLCINSSISNNWTLGEGQIFYTSSGYVDRRYYLFENTTLTNNTQNITLYSLVSGDQTSFKLEVEDTSLNPYADYFTTLVRWYNDLDEYNVVDMGLTDETGSTVIHVKTEDVDYRIGVYYKNGTLVKLAEPIRMVCLLSPCTYTLKIAPTEIDYTSFLNIDYSLDYNRTTGIWSFVFSDSSQLTSKMNLTVYRITGTSIYPVCSSSVTAYSGAITCNTSLYTGTLKAIVQRSASPPVTIAEKVESISTTAFSSTFGLWISIIIGLPIIFIFAFMSPLGAVVGGVIGLIPALYFGAINWAILGGVAVLAGIVMHFLKRIG